jgi:hypothetical protein
METRIAILGPEDRHLLARVADGVFDREIRPEWCEAFLGDARHHLAVALDDADVVVGMASGVHYGNPDKPAAMRMDAGCGGREVDPQPVMFQFRIEGEGCGLRA